MAEKSIRKLKTPEERRITNRIAVKRWRLNNPERHAANQRRNNLRRYYDLKSKNLCALCGKVPPRPDFVYCEPCGKKVRECGYRRKKELAEAGICNACGKNPCLKPLVGKRDCFCERCYFKKTSTDCLKTAKHAELIGEKLKAQNYRCAYTGELIVLGVNDSLDHILPISRFPELRSDPSNVEWVTRKINCMKWDSTQEEFLETARLVVSHIS